MSYEAPFKDFRITPKVAKFLFFMEKNGKISYDMQEFSNPIDYYQMLKYLRQFGLVFQDGLERNNQKIWRLTQKGMNLATLLKKVDMVMEINNHER